MAPQLARPAPRNENAVSTRHANRAGSGRPNVTVEVKVRFLVGDLGGGTFPDLDVSSDDPRPPPCARCMRESIQSQCILASKRIRSHIEASESRHHEPNSAGSPPFCLSDHVNT